MTSDAGRHRRTRGETRRRVPLLVSLPNYQHVSRRSVSVVASKGRTDSRVGVQFLLLDTRVSFLHPPEGTRQLPNPFSLDSSTCFPRPLPPLIPPPPRSPPHPLAHPHARHPHPQPRPHRPRRRAPSSSCPRSSPSATQLRLESMPTSSAGTRSGGCSSSAGATRRNPRLLPLLTLSSRSKRNVGPRPKTGPSISAAR